MRLLIFLSFSAFAKKFVPSGTNETTFCILHHVGRRRGAALHVENSKPRSLKPLNLRYGYCYIPLSLILHVPINSTPLARESPPLSKGQRQVDIMRALTVHRSTCAPLGWGATKQVTSTSHSHSVTRDRATRTSL